MPQEVIKNKEHRLQIAFASRLEYEKWADIVIDIIHTLIENHDMWYFFHIFSEGRYKQEFELIQRKHPHMLKVHGHVSEENLRNTLITCDVLLMPSRFLETFWLLTLEALSLSIPVIGRWEWWWKDMIALDYVIRKDFMKEDTLRILEKMQTWWRWECGDIKNFSYEAWQNNISKILWVSKNILIIHDYTSLIWWAEKYVHFLHTEIKLLGKNSRVYWKKWNLSHLQRHILFFTNLFDFRRYFEIKNILKEMNPDFIWLHSVLRYIGPWWMKAVYESGIPYVISHHDLGLIVARPQETKEEKDIGNTLSLRNFMKGVSNPLEYLMRLYKYLNLYFLWKYLRNAEYHIVPSLFMKAPYEKISGKNCIVFPHTVKKG